METISSKVTSKGQVVIPKKLREKYGIRTATAIRWIEKDQGILMVPESEDPIVEARGMLKGSGILKAYMKEKDAKKKRRIRELQSPNSFVFDSYALIGYLENESFSDRIEHVLTQAKNRNAFYYISMQFTSVRCII